MYPTSFIKTRQVGALRSIIVHDHESAVLFCDGQFVRELKPGKHRMPFSAKLHEIHTVDLREHQFAVQGQELLTSDQIVLKVSAVVSYRVNDVLKLLRATDQVEMALYTEVQLALRQVVSALSAEDFLAKKQGFGTELKQALDARARSFGLQVERADIRDVMLPAELKRAYSEALKSKQESHAALEKARSETAALRTLANAAKIMRDNPELLSLRTLQTLGEMGSRGNHTMVLPNLAQLLAQTSS